jgi:hypothetical protein
MGVSNEAKNVIPLKFLRKSRIFFSCELNPGIYCTYIYSVETLTGIKIHNLDIGNFCKKSQNRSIFVFPCPHFGVYGFCLSASGSSQSPLTFFFQMIPRLKDYLARNTTHYLFPEYFQSLRAKK